MPITSNKSDCSLPIYSRAKSKIRKFSINERHNTFEKIRHHGHGNYSKFHVTNSKLIEELIADHFKQIGPQLTKVKKIRKFSINERHNTFEKIRHHGRENYSKFHDTNSKLIEELIADHFKQIEPQLTEL